MLFSLGLLASLSFVSAAPMQVIWPPVVATVKNTPITGYQLAIGPNGLAVVQQSGLQTQITYDNGGFGFEVNGQTQWLNLGPGSPESGSLPLEFSSKQVTTAWQAGPGQNILNAQYGSSNFQVCEEGGVYVVRLVTPSASEPVRCYYTQLMVYSD